MKNTKLWIADPDLAYVQAFAEYVNLKKVIYSRFVPARIRHGWNRHRMETRQRSC